MAANIASRILGKKKRQPEEDEVEVVGGGAAHGVGAVTMTALEVIAAQAPVVLHVSDYQLDGGTPLELALDGAEHAPLLS